MVCLESFAIVLLLVMVGYCEIGHSNMPGNSDTVSDTLSDTPDTVSDTPDTVSDISDIVSDTVF